MTDKCALLNAGGWFRFFVRSAEDSIRDFVSEDSTRPEGDLIFSIGVNIGGARGVKEKYPKCLSRQYEDLLKYAQSKLPEETYKLTELYAR
ncbi:MAG: hypothetical protein CMH61_01625 [Nanoarchaeota archaeon]|nr:hypothetical protein [Nanoarchaeota archaeon]